MTDFSRRTFLLSAGAALGSEWLHAAASRKSPLDYIPFVTETNTARSATTLQCVMRTTEVNGKAASVMGIVQPDGTQGIASTVNLPFKVLVENKLAVPTAIHWHGLHPPNNQDGVPGLTQPVIQPDTSALYDFPLRPAGTHWMHSHQGLQEAFQLSAPLIVHDTSDKQRDEQEVVLFLGDFSFTRPRELYAKLRQPKMSGMNEKTRSPGSPASAMKMSMGKPDANDVNYDAYLANDRTLKDPEVIQVERSGHIRLRIINGSSGTNYFIDLGSLSGTLLATDGMAVHPVSVTRVPLAIAQRVDVKVQIPHEGGAFPILALREGALEQTGIVLATPGARIKTLPNKNATPAGLLTLDLENRLSAVRPLRVKTVDQTCVLRLQGDMARYEWSINGIVFDTSRPAAGKAQVKVKYGQRVALKYVNETGMSHPMHLHGHSFQVIGINGHSFRGPVRDTVLVPPRTSVTVAFDAINPGVWYLHCHVLWHLAAGMATLVQYEA